ncbi:hypothetical protein PM082_003202 [Marasmius tenuissimus]|nr:hypothetical protein PM082_003202 [Marasmius tenuissimus]
MALNPSLQLISFWIGSNPRKRVEPGEELQEQDKELEEEEAWRLGLETNLRVRSTALLQGQFYTPNDPY